MIPTCSICQAPIGTCAHSYPGATGNTFNVKLSFYGSSGYTGYTGYTGYSGYHRITEPAEIEAFKLWWYENKLDDAEYDNLREMILSVDEESFVLAELVIKQLKCEES